LFRLRTEPYLELGPGFRELFKKPLREGFAIVIATVLIPVLGICARARNHVFPGVLVIIELTHPVEMAVVKSLKDHVERPLPGLARFLDELFSVLL
jgi:hypothetical protein